MPRLVSSLILQAKREGWPKCNILRIAQTAPFYLTDNAWDVNFESNDYLANGLLLKVDSGSMSAGDPNDWTFVISAVDPSTDNNVLGQKYINRWVYHHKMYFQETATGTFPIGTEAKKFGRILTAKASKNNDTASITFTVTGPNGDSDDVKVVQTNNLSQHRHFGADDTIMQHAHETSYEVKMPRTIGGNWQRLEGGELP
jgi:hypothetical protein